jgi:hypothetical protein
MFSFASSKENYGGKFRADGRRTEIRLHLFVALNTSQMLYYSDIMLSVTQYQLTRFKDLQILIKIFLYFLKLWLRNEC